MSQDLVLSQPGPEKVQPNGVPAMHSQPVLLQRTLQRMTVEFLKPESRPTNMLLGTINHCEYRVLRPIPVHLGAEGNGAIASWQEVDEFGTGRTISLACDDLGRTIAELYESLEADQANLGPDLARVWSVLKEYVARRS
jgi:hypothetical protein